MAASVETRGPSVGFVGLLTLLFIGFKLAGIIDWSWVWVLAPIWISAALFVMIVAGLVILTVIMKPENW